MIVPYHIAESYLSKCKKVCRCKQIDPEYCDEGLSSSDKVVDSIVWKVQFSCIEECSTIGFFSGR